MGRGWDLNLVAWASRFFPRAQAVGSREKGACPGGSSGTLVAPPRPTRASAFGQYLQLSWLGGGVQNQGQVDTVTTRTHRTPRPGQGSSGPHRAPAGKRGAPPPSSTPPCLPTPALGPSLTTSFQHLTPPPPPTTEPGCAFLTLKLRHLGLLLLQRVPQGHLDQRGGSEPGLLCLGAGPVPEPWDQRHFPFISPPTLPLPLSLLP